MTFKDIVVNKMKVIIGIPGDSFSQKFLLTWSKTLCELSKNYDISISPGKSSFVPFARMQTLGLNVLRGKDQKPFNGQHYDVFVSIDSDIVWDPSQLFELIESTKIHPVVSGYYMMDDNKNFSVVEKWDTDYLKNFGTFKFLQIPDLENSPKFMDISYTGLGFFACRKEVLDSLTYPYFHCDLQTITGNDVEIVSMCGEDVAFCKNIKDSGYDIMLHTSLRVGHEKKMVL